MRRAVPGLLAAFVSIGVAPALAQEQPLRAAGHAAERLSFVGVLDVRWLDGATAHAESLLVQASNGSVVVKGDNTVMASPQQRLVEHAGGVWDLLWPVTAVGAARPPASRKYQFINAAPAAVSGRSARVVEVRWGGQLLERLALDEATGLLLRREQFENGGGPSRTVEFQSISFNPTTVDAATGKIVNAAPEVVPPTRIPSGISAPRALTDGYERVGLYRRSGVMQVLYSDGLYDLSVFEQRGRLDRQDLPEGDSVQIGESRGWHGVWPGGHVLVWERSGTVYTAVSDAPLDQLLGAVRSLPPASAPRSFLRQLRQVCRLLIEPLAS